MAVVAMLPAELSEVADELAPEDELLTAEELETVSLFESLKRAPSFARFPGTTVLRRCRRGRVMCTQGEAGATAFYILPTEDVLELREKQLEAIEEVLVAKAAGQSVGRIHRYFESMSERELRRREREIADEIERLRARLREAPPLNSDDGAPQRQVASANLLVNLEGGRRTGLLHRLFGGLRKGAPGGPRRPQYIPIDGPADLDARTLRGSLHEGELLGEMSCINRAPRSATVIAEQDCYMLEMLRNVMDMLHSDPAYKKRMEATYRQRVLESHVRRLSVFEDLSDEEFARLSRSIELVEYPSGATIFEEHDPADCFYVIRSGLVKVIKNAWYFARDEEFTDARWQGLCEELLDASGEHAAYRRTVRDALPADVRDALDAAAGGAPLGLAKQRALIESLNGFIRDGKLHTQLGKTTADVLEAVDGPQLRVLLQDYPRETDRWSELEYRTFQRLVLEQAFPTGMPRRVETSGPRRTLAYLGRGDILGEMGVLLDQPRSATCIAYDHPDSGYYQRIPDARTGAVPPRVELVRISKQDFQEFLAGSPAVRSKVEQIMAQRQREVEASGRERGRRVGLGVTQSHDFEELGLIQGQELMLIDLERCTRCNACVEACVAAHDDGRTRLYLDGPRIEKFLVPLTCRKCLDPVCMIGCPVGSINRGENGEIQIRDWCIGCSMCADQCPYGSIQMNELEKPADVGESLRASLGPDASLKVVTERAVVCDLCSSLPSQRPSCVYACPHDAAMRVNAQTFFFEEVPVAD